MKSIGLFCLFALLGLNQNTVSAQRYSNIIDQKFDESDLLYMPAEELNILKNEIIALKGIQTNDKGTADANPYVQYTCTSTFLNESDQANLELIRKMQGENTELNCSEQELFGVFLQLAASRQAMPVYLAEKFYGVPLDQEMIEHQKVISLSEELTAFWVPQFSKGCDICPYLNHFIITNNTGEKMASLEVEGLLSILEENIVEVKYFSANKSGTTTQPEYYQIMDNGQLISTESQVVQVPRG